MLDFFRPLGHAPVTMETHAALTLVDRWRMRSVHSLNKAGGIPNPIDPSDHLLIAACFAFPAQQVPQAPTPGGGEPGKEAAAPTLMGVRLGASIATSAVSRGVSAYTVSCTSIADSELPFR